MVAETCNDCGLPAELCVCKDIDRTESSNVIVSVEEAGFADKDMTVISGVPSEEDLDEISTELKSSLGAGGTTKNGKIQIQGNHTKTDHRVSTIRDALEKRGYEPIIETDN